MRMATTYHGGSVLALAMALAVACGSGEEPAPPAPAPAGQPAPAPTPEPAPDTPEPAAGGAGGGDVARGRQLYETYCASCHGLTGDADGPLAANLDPQPAKHSDAAYMDALSDEHLFQVIKNGGPAVGKSPLMAPWGGTLSDAQIRDVIAYTRSLAH